MSYKIFFLYLFCFSPVLCSSTTQVSDNVYAIVLAGGSGERLWPLSTKNTPKQLLPFMGSQSLLEQSIDRVKEYVLQENIWVVTIADQEKTIKNAVGHLVGKILVEPCSRNTAAAIMYTALTIYALNPDAVLVFLSSDHYIPQNDRFIECIDQAVQFSSAHDIITLLGLVPTYPATGYGYIAYESSENVGPAPIKSFCEKPNSILAEQYISQNYLWNSGIFIGKASIFIRESEECSPDILHAVKVSLKNPNSYQDIPSLSIDYAVMEKSKHLAVLPADFIWADVGNLESFLSLYKKEDIETVTIDAFNNLVEVPAHRLVALVGVNNLCIVEHGNSLIIIERSKVEKIKEVIKVLHHKKLIKYL